MYLPTSTPKNYFSLVPPNCVPNALSMRTGERCRVQRTPSIQATRDLSSACQRCNAHKPPTAIAQPNASRCRGVRERRIKTAKRRRPSRDHTRTLEMRSTTKKTKPFLAGGGKRQAATKPYVRVDCLIRIPLIRPTCPPQKNHFTEPYPTDKKHPTSKAPFPLKSLRPPAHHPNHSRPSPRVEPQSRRKA